MTEASDNDKRNPLVEPEEPHSPSTDKPKDAAPEKEVTSQLDNTSTEDSSGQTGSRQTGSRQTGSAVPRRDEILSDQQQPTDESTKELLSKQTLSEQISSESEKGTSDTVSVEESAAGEDRTAGVSPEKTEKDALPSAAQPGAAQPGAAQSDEDQLNETQVDQNQPNETSPEETPTAANQSPAEVEPAAEAAVASPDATEEESEEDSDEEETDDENEEVDYSAYHKEALATAAVQLAKGEHSKEAYAQVQQMKPHFDALEEEDRQAALQKFTEEGGEEEGFDYKPDAYSIQFYQAYRHILEQRSARRKTQKRQEQENLKAKETLLNKLREFLDDDETQVSINWIKEVQAEWKAIGNGPAQHNRTLWANYNALMDRFYNNRSIYFELKELDRRKNLELKQALAERAEALKDVENVREAVRQLDELHEEYKHVGPVPQEEQEPLWQRFKAASDLVHDRRRAEVDKFKEELNENLAKKEKTAEEVAPFVEFNSESIKEWNQKTKEIQALQKQWNEIGSMPRGKAKEVNKKFWTPFKQFFANKSEFFKRLDQAREGNLQKKEALVAQADALKESTDWRTTAQKLKDLQQEWKAIGPVPGKVREEIYQRFRAACDYFFEQRRSSHQEQDNEYAANLKAKQEICAEIEKLTQAGVNDTQKLVELSDRFAAVGFVPRNAMKSIAQRFEKTVAAFLKQAEVSETKKQDVQSEVELASLKSSPDADRKIDRKESGLQRQISQLEGDIALWENNMSFFAASNKANKLKADFEKRIEEARQEVDKLKSQLKAVRNIR